MFGAFPRGVHRTCLTFLPQVAIDAGIAEQLQLKKMISPCKNTRDINKQDMKHNSYCPVMDVHPETYEVRADGELLTCEPADVLPMAQRYFLF